MIYRYKMIGYNIYVLQQTACLVVIPITVGKDLSVIEIVGASIRLLSGPSGLNCWISFAQYSVLCTVVSLSLLSLPFIS